MHIEKYFKILRFLYLILREYITQEKTFIVPRVNYICVNFVQTTGQNLIQN